MFQKSPNSWKWEGDMQRIGADHFSGACTGWRPGTLAHVADLAAKYLVQRSILAQLSFTGSLPCCVSWEQCSKASRHFRSAEWSLHQPTKAGLGLLLAPCLSISQTWRISWSAVQPMRFLKTKAVLKMHYLYHIRGPKKVRKTKQECRNNNHRNLPW